MTTEPNSPALPHEFISFDGTHIYYDVVGNASGKKTLIFLHGLGGNNTIWKRVMLHFQKQGFQTIAFDLRGHGFSGRPSEFEAYSIEKISQDIITYINQNKLSHVILVGHCLGGMTALKVAEKLNTAIDALVVISTSTNSPNFAKYFFGYPTVLSSLAKVILKVPQPMGKIEEITFERFYGTDDLDPGRLFSDLVHTTLQPYLAISGNIASVKNQYNLDKITVPTLIIHGARDSVFPVDQVFKLNQKIKSSKVIVVPTGNHILPLNNHEEVTQHLDHFIKHHGLPKRKTKISVVIPAYNEEKYIETCLNHLFNQTELPDEVIVVDNNSTDKTVELAKKYPVKIIRESQQGITPARNKGFNAAKYSIIGRIDADTILPPTWISEIKARFEMNRSMIAFSGGTIFTNRALDTFLKIPSFAYFTSFKKIMGCDCLYGPNMAVRRSAWHKVKQHICNDDHLVHEDADLAIHLSELQSGEIVFDSNFLVEVSNRRFGKPNQSYLEYPQRYFKMILHHKETLQTLIKEKQKLETSFKNHLPSLPSPRQVLRMKK